VESVETELSKVSQPAPGLHSWQARFLKQFLSSK
jgi:hypothetical protein